MRAKVGPQADKFAGGHRIRVPPVPIPNTEVKPDTADGTIWETVWESRSLPALLQTKRPDAHRSVHRVFLLYGDQARVAPDGSHAGRRRRSRPASRGAASEQDVTIWETVWESRSLPALLQTKRPDAHRSVHRVFLFVRRPGTGCSRWFPCRRSAAQPPREPRSGERARRHYMGNCMGE